MKTLTLCLITMVITMVIITTGFKTNANAQNLIKIIDTMNEKVYFMFDKKLVLLDEPNQKGFSIELFVLTDGENTDSDGNPIVRGITTKSANIGTCNEKDELIILFDDDSKIKLIAFNSFNCEGNGYYKLKPDEYLALKNKKIKKARLTNGKSYESLTVDISPEKQSYFMTAINNVESKTFSIEKD